MRVALLCIALTGCLIAPSRPGGDDSPGECLPATTPVGEIAVADLGDGKDTIIRAMAQSPFDLLLFDGTAPDATCPKRRIHLSVSNIVAIAAINVVKVDGAPRIFALARRSEGAAVETFEPDGTSLGVVSTNGMMGTQGGFVTYNANQLWFGGDQAIFVGQTGFGGAASQPAITGGGAQQRWYLAGALPPPSNVPFTVVGSNSSHGAQLVADTIALDARSGGRCSVACVNLVAHDIELPTRDFEAYTVTQDVTVETIQGQTTGTNIQQYAPPATSPQPLALVDARLDQIEGTAVLDVVTLWGNSPTPELWLYTDRVGPNQTGSYGKVTLDFSNVLRVVTVRASPKRIVVVGTTAGAQACFTATPALRLDPCT